MSINNLPAALQSVIQQGFLEREFEDACVAKLGFRDIADREDFADKIGETVTKTRTGLLPAITTPLATAANSDITSGLTPQNYSVEQYVLTVNQYAGNMQLNIATARVAIADLYLRNAKTLAEQATRSIDTLAANALFASYLGGNTRVRVALTAASATVSVDDIRGFQTTLNSAGQVVAVSSANTMTVTLGTNAATAAGTANGYTLIGAAADATNVSTSPGGISGVLTFASNVSTTDGAIANSVIASIAPKILRPGGATNVSLLTSANTLTIQTLLTAKANLEANRVPPVTSSGLYRCYADPLHVIGLYADPAFQSFTRGRIDSPEYRRGVLAELLGMEIVETNLNPVQTVAGAGAPVRNAIVVGQGALVEGVFTNNAYAGALDEMDDMITVSNGIAHVTREPLDALKQVVTQSWSYIGGFVVPTDTTTTPNTIPTASNAAYKRAVVVQSC